MGTNDAVVTATIWLFHYLCPLLIFFYYIISSIITVCTLHRRKTSSHLKTACRKKLVYVFTAMIILSYAGHAVMLFVRTLLNRGWWASKHEVIYTLGSTIVWVVLLLSLLDTKNVVWYPFIGCWLLGLACEIVLILLPNTKGHSWSPYDKARTALLGFRILLLLLLPTLFFSLPQTRYDMSEPSAEEDERLLGAENAASRVVANYGAFDDSESDTEENKNMKEKIRTKMVESGNWWTYAKSFTVFWPLIWPSNAKSLQVSMILVGFTILGQRVLNVLVPRQLGIITDALANQQTIRSLQENDQQSAHGKFPWLEVILFVLYKLLNSNAGLPALKDYLWIPIDQYSHRSITTAAYNHIMSLSFDFHSNRRSGDLFQSISAGRSINWFVELMLFTFFPMLVDLGVAFIYLYILFDAYMALIVAFVSVTYLWVTAKLGQYRRETRRDYNKAMRKESDIIWETLGGWQTVSYYNRIGYEQNRFASAVTTQQGHLRRFQIGISLIHATQALVFTAGLLGACFLAVYQISKDDKPIGAFVTLLTYWAQLASPLSFFGDFMRRIHVTMIDAERLLALFQTKPSVKNSEHAKDLILLNGEVKFHDVSFSYDPRKTIIKDLTFTAKAGSTTAFVGETGGGKTTLLKLLFRFYNVEKGIITIDGQNIQDITVESLRENIGVVPQDPTLFNDTIFNNLKYANFKATEEEVYSACRAAAIHKKIETFPDKYFSRVGERGVKLSGGELQRIAIARAILKNPKIILLDEATSMVDLETERKIQSAVHELCKNRTTFVVAHRLSTVMNADMILVIKDGQIIESGNHDRLFAKRGKYYRLWSKQIKNDCAQKEEEYRPPLVNDLSPNSKSTELVKYVNDRASQNKVVSDDIKSPKKSKQSHETYAQAETSGKPLGGLFHSLHRKKESVLKPNATEFISEGQHLFIDLAGSNSTSRKSPVQTSKFTKNRTSDDEAGKITQKSSKPSKNSKSDGESEQGLNKARPGHRKIQSDSEAMSQKAERQDIRVLEPMLEPENGADELSSDQLKKRFRRHRSKCKKQTEQSSTGNTANSTATSALAVEFTDRTQQGSCQEDGTRKESESYKKKQRTNLYGATGKRDPLDEGLLSAEIPAEQNAKSGPTNTTAYATKSVIKDESEVVGQEHAGQPSMEEDGFMDSNLVALRQPSPDSTTKKSYS